MESVFIITRYDAPLGAFTDLATATKAAQTLANNLEDRNTGATVHLLVTEWQGAEIIRDTHIYGVKA